MLRAFALLCALIGLPLAGCGPGGPATVPVSGKVLHNGQPLTAGSVTFVPEAAGQPEPVGSIAADGSYTLATGDQPGAPVGSYKVVVRATVPSNPNDPYSLPKSVLPPKYSDPAKTDLRVEVVASASPEAYELKLTN